MFAVNHAATAMVIKKKYPKASLFGLLISVQFIELIWVALNYLGVEFTITEAEVHSVTDIHLAHMPWSHSVGMTIIFALMGWAIFRYLFNKPDLALPIALGILSHIVLDVLTHVSDIAIFPFVSWKTGLGVYAIPWLGLVIETAYGIWCWWYAQANRIILAVILFFNLSNISFFTTSINGPETWLAGHPIIIVSVIFVQIMVTLFLIGRYYNIDYNTVNISANIDVTESKPGFV